MDQNKLLSLFVFIFALGLSACSRSGDVQLTINTGIPVRAPSTPNINPNLSSLMSVTIGQECYQDQFFLVIHDPVLNKIVASSPLKLKTRLSAAVPTPTPITYGTPSANVDKVINRLILDSSLDEQPVVLIPRDRDVEVGFIGSFFDPTDANNDGICDQVSGSIAINSSSVFGHTLVNEQARINGSISLSLDVMHTNPSGSYPLGSYGSRYKNWLQLDTAFMVSGYAARLKKITFLDINTGQPGSMEISVDNGSTTNYYIPHLFPYILEFYWTGGGNAGTYRTLVTNPDPVGTGLTATIVTGSGTGSPPSTISSASSPFTITSY